MLSLHIIKTHISHFLWALSLKPLQKRASFSSSFLLRTSLKGSMALEGSLVLPIFLFYMITILYCFEIIRFQSDVFEAMHQAGSRAWAVAYETADASNAVSYSMTEENALQTCEDVRQYLKNQILPCLCVEDNENGVMVTTKTNYLGKGNLEIKVSYQIKPIVGWLPIGDIKVQDTCFWHGFVGYTGNISKKDNDIEEIYVYVTSSGTKYHLLENCTYLRIKVQSVNPEALKELRNASSEIYRPCEICKPKTEGIFYLTKWGNRYHGISDCSALKRTVYLIPISQVGSRTACSKCS